MATAEAALAALESIAASCKSIDEWMEAINGNLIDLMHHVGVPDPDEKPKAAVNTQSVPTIASDRDLDGQYGNPEVKAKSPRNWTGESQQGKRFSQCPPEYLDMVADRLDYFAEQNSHSQDHDEQKKARYNRIDASRARGWAQRLRAGWQPPPEEASAGSSNGAPLTDDDIPF